MDLNAYLAALRKHLIVICAATLIGVGGSLALFWRTPPIYASTIQFYVSTPLPDGTNAQAAGQFAQARVNSYVKLLSSEELASRVVRFAGLDLDPIDVAREISAEADVNTVLVTAQVTDQIPARAQKIAEGLAAEFGPMVDELDNAGRQNALVVINIVSGPSLQSRPVAPDLRLFVLVGLAVGLIAGVGYALLRELLDTSISTSTEAQEVTGSPVLGTIPFDPLVRKNPLIIGNETMSARAEAYRKLRTNLQFIGAAQSADSILVTSSLPGEGKSVTAVNLALSLVELGQRTLLIDADMRKPQISNYLDIANEVGLSNVLAGQLQPADAVQAWGDQGLYVLPSGTIPPNPSELLGSERMKTLLAQFGTEYDHVILDSPPVLPVTDAAVAARQVDAVLVVIRADYTPRNDVSHAISALYAVKAPVVGTLLNMRKIGRTDQEYGRDYYRHGVNPVVPASLGTVESPDSPSEPTEPESAAPVEVTGLVETDDSGTSQGSSVEVLDGAKAPDDTDGANGEVVAMPIGKTIIRPPGRGATARARPRR